MDTSNLLLFALVVVDFGLISLLVAVAAHLDLAGDALPPLVAVRAALVRLTYATAMYVRQ